MKKSRLSEQQIVFILQKADILRQAKEGVSVGDVC